MSNRIRKIKSKAMQDRWVIMQRNSQGVATSTKRVRVNNGAVQNGGSNLMRTRNNTVIKRNQYNKNGTGNVLNMTLSDSCCTTSKVAPKPVVHYSYMNYLNKKVRTCTKKDQNGNRCNNIFKKIPDIGSNGGSSTYIENKKSKVLLCEERNLDGTKRNPEIDFADKYGKNQNCCNNPNDKLRILANNAKSDNITKPVAGNNFELETTFKKYVGKSYSQLRNDKKPNITKPLPFNPASLQIAKVKSRRNIKGSGTCNRATPYERANANIQSCKHI